MSISTGVKKALAEAERRNYTEAFRQLRVQASGMRLVTPASLSLTAGTSANTVTDLQTMLDGNVYNLAEAAGVPGMQLALTFTGVQEIYGLLLRAYYAGSSTHWCEVQLYNYTTLAWDVYMTVESGNGFNVRYIRVPDDADYISGGEAQVRWEHPASGNASHDAYIDYVGLEG